MNWILGMLAGYIIHDALQPTPVGQVLDKIALPADLFVSEPAQQSGVANDQTMV